MYVFMVCKLQKPAHSILYFKFGQRLINENTDAPT